MICPSSVRDRTNRSLEENLALTKKERTISLFTAESRTQSHYLYIESRPHVHKLKNILNFLNFYFTHCFEYENSNTLSKFWLIIEITVKIMPVKNILKLLLRGLYIKQSPLDRNFKTRLD